MIRIRTKTKLEKIEAHKKERLKGQNPGSMQGHRAFSDRRSTRRAELGRQTEDRVSALLEKKQKQGELISFIRHPANSQEDRAGKDFTVSRMIEDEIVTASFGVTITPVPQGQGDIPEIIIPPEMGDERIWYRICQICKK